MNKIYASIFIFCVAITSAQNLSHKLQACYPLNGNAQNLAPTGSPLNGLLSNVTSTTGHTGAANTGYYLGGNINSYIELPDHAGIKSDSVFFSGWFKFDSFNYLQYLVYTTNGCSGNFEAYSLTADPSNNVNLFCLSKAGTNCNPKPQIYSQTPIVIGTWYHVAFYIDNSMMKLYVNGTLEASTPHTVGFGYQPGMSVFLGVTNQTFFDEPLNGSIDNVRFYNRELTAQEVSLLYSQDPPCIAPGLPETTFTASKKQICAGSTITFSDQSTNNPTSWYWQFPGGFPPSSGFQNPVVNYSIPGVYSVSLTATNAQGTGNTSVQTITVTSCVSLAENNPLSPLVFYPSPASDHLFIENSGQNKVVVTDMFGRSVKFSTSQPKENVVEIYFPAAANGTNLVSIVSPEGERIAVHKLVLVN